MSEIFKRPLAQTDLDDLWDYLIFYLPLTNGIEVVRVLYGRRDIERIFAEEGEEEEM
ncbi:hypothetical protein [Coleofasciculus sp. E1-EBD-02]|uniref:hypothetical protein n=1 Tax=Coleofasciculus sp. E1-EBD-02 TaxID=3068481 RepID=UPI0032F9DD09